MGDDYARELHIKAPTSAVYAALTTLDGCSALWALRAKRRDADERA